MEAESLNILNIFEYVPIPVQSGHLCIMATIDTANNRPKVERISKKIAHIDTDIKFLQRCKKAEKSRKDYRSQTHSNRPTTQTTRCTGWRFTPIQSVIVSLSKHCLLNLIAVTDSQSDQYSLCCLWLSTQSDTDLLQRRYVKSTVSYASELLCSLPLASGGELYSGLGKDSLASLQVEACCGVKDTKRRTSCHRPLNT